MGQNSPEQADASGREDAPSKGPVRMLCDEIGFPWDRRLERDDLFVIFVRGLVAEIEHKRWMQLTVAGKFGGTPPSEGSGSALSLADTMFHSVDRLTRIERARAVHDLCHELNPDEAYPTDHLIDMVSSCASAIRFGLETPCHSRHAAEAASHICGQVYGLFLFDSHTPGWKKEWARAKLTDALISLLPPLDGGEAIHSRAEVKSGSEP